MIFQRAICHFLISTAAISCTTLAFASDSLRCGGLLVQEGDSKARVTQICGAPQTQDSFCKPVKLQQNQLRNADSHYAPSCERIETWTYDQGYGKLQVTLEFKEGQVVDIINGDRH